MDFEEFDDSPIFRQQDSKLHFAKLDDSPMFRQQIQGMEEIADALRERTSKFSKGCRKYTEGLGEEYDRDIAFASALETFAGHSDPICAALGGPVMTKFAIALREIGTYKEILRSQVEHMLSDRLLQFVNVDLPDVKEARKRFDKANVVYDQAREKYLALRKSTRMDIAAPIEEELHIARSVFEQARFNLVGALAKVEAKKRFEFLEVVSGTMDAHLRFFQQGYKLLHQLQPYISEMLIFSIKFATSCGMMRHRYEPSMLASSNVTCGDPKRQSRAGIETLLQLARKLKYCRLVWRYMVMSHAQQSRESFKYEQEALSDRMQEFKRQVDRESRLSLNGSPNGDSIHPFPISSHKAIKVVMQSAADGKVQTIKQGYLSKRSSNLRGDWKRRFFVLDNRGMLYYYRKQWTRSSGSGSQLPVHRNNPSEPGSGLLSRWLSSHYHGGVHDEKSVARHTVNLLTSTIKIDADQSDLRFCFRIISPTKNYTLQAECALEQMDWIEKITGVIASLLTSQSPERCLCGSPITGSHGCASDSSSIGNSSDFDQRAIGQHIIEKDFPSKNLVRASRSLQQLQHSAKSEKLVNALKRVPGNDKCADCGASEPDWASLNLAVLICIECSGVHRNLGVHISKVRSLGLDVKVWEPSVIDLFQALGNVFVNSVWEGLLQARRTFQADEIPIKSYESDKHKQFFSKPSHDANISKKEKFIHAKYAEKRFVHRGRDNQHLLLVAQQLWESVRANDKKAAYRLIVTYEADVNAIHGQALSLASSLNLCKALQLQEQAQSPDRYFDCLADSLDASLSSSISPRESEDQFLNEILDGCSLLHLACQTADIGMVELLLQHGAKVNATDSRGQTPLHHSIIRGRIRIVKLLLTRGADPQALDKEGKTPFQLVTESCDDVEVLALLKNPNR